MQQNECCKMQKKKKEKKIEYRKSKLVACSRESVN